MDKQYWTKSGIIYNGNEITGYSYAAVPIVMFLSNDSVRVFFTSRNFNNISHPFYLDYDLVSKKITAIATKPILDIGELGCFDDSGVMPTCLVNNNGELWLYYIGWNLGVTVPFRNAIGLAISNDGGQTFKRAFNGPILDRTKTEPHFNASACVLLEDGKWKIWYLSCVKWVKENNAPRHYYHIKYAESVDGINWNRQGKVAIDFKSGDEYAISVPRVIKEDGIYKMWYSYRGTTYRIGYAESGDGISWIRKDELVNLDVSTDGWDSDMICYPFIFDHKGERYMLYNGNGYGKTGLGIAQLMK